MPTSPLRALAATTGTAPDPPFLPPLAALVEVAGAEPAFRLRYHQAPMANMASTGSHNHRLRDGCRFGGVGDGTSVPCSSITGTVSFCMSLTRECYRASRPRSNGNPPATSETDRDISLIILYGRVNASATLHAHASHS